MTTLPMVDCEPYRCRLSVLSCAARYRKAGRDPMTSTAIALCKGCDVGKRNAECTGDSTADNPHARDCAVCGARFVPENFAAYANACGKICRSVLQKGRDTTYIQRAASKRARKARSEEGWK